MAPGGAARKVRAALATPALLGALAGAFLLAPAPAGAAGPPWLYWSNIDNAQPRSISRSDLNGATRTSNFITTPWNPYGLFVNSSSIYWGQYSGEGIGRANVDGSGQDKFFITGADSPTDITSDDDSIYWANNGSGTIGRANLDGTAVDQSFIGGLTDVYAVWATNDYLYWTQGATGNGPSAVGRAVLPSGQVDTGFRITGAAVRQPASVVTDENYAYWTNSAGAATIARADLDGSLDTEDPFVTAGPNGSEPYGLAISGQYLYWTLYATNFIGRANVNGTGVQTSFIGAPSAKVKGPGSLALSEYMLSVSLSGTGSGTVTSSPTGIACPDDCLEEFPQGESVTLTAAAGDSSQFTGWGGACSGSSPTCTVTMSQAQSVTATFDTLPPASYQLTAGISGSGTGTVTSEPAGISCPSDCVQGFTSGTAVTLTPTPADGSRFTGWSGACSGTGPCTVTMDQARSVTAGFDTLPPSSFTLSVENTGDGLGNVTSTPAGIDCPGDCSQGFAAPSLVTLTAAPGDGSTFAGWGGACSGTGPCTVTMSQARSVTAEFDTLPPASFNLSVTDSGTGSGTVTSEPPGIDCGVDCVQGFVSGSTVTLTASPDDDSTFTGWGGACSGTGPCTVTMTQARSVTATFDTLPPSSYTLTVSGTGSGSGSVTSTPPGIDCGADCRQGFTAGASVTLAAAPDDDSQFTGWGGGCSGTSTTCTVTMDQARSVTATFETLPATAYLLTVETADSGYGTVTSTPPGIDCGADCRQKFPAGSTVSLRRTALPDGSFAGWSGACDGSRATCQVTMDKAQTVGAAFEPNNDFTIRWIRGESRRVTERVAVPGAGRIILRGTRKARNGLPVTACRGTFTLRRAGSFIVACALTAATRRTADSRAVRIRVATTYDPAASGAIKTRYRTVILRRPHFTG